MLRRAADLAHDHPRRVLFATLAAFLVCVVLGGPVAGLLSTSGDFADPTSESEVTAERIERATGRADSPAVVALVELPAPGDSTITRRRLAGVAATLADDPDVADVDGYEETGERAFISRDGRSAYLAAFLRAGADEDAVGERLEGELSGAADVRLGGSAIAGPAVGKQVSKDLARAELLAFPILFLLSLWVFRGFVAALLPLFVGVLTIFGTFLGLRLVNEATALSIYALNLAIGLGLGLAIDYSLFVVSRYREELARSGPGREALRRTLTTAGRTIVFSSLTVAAALLSLTCFSQRFLFSMGISGAITALVAASASLVALPALLALLGSRVHALSPARWRRAAGASARGEHGFWYRLPQAVMRRAGPVALVTALVMIGLGLPFLRVVFTGVDATALPRSTEARQVDTALRTNFEAARTTPLTVVVDAPSDPGAAINAYTRRLADLPGVANVSRPRRLGAEAWVFEVGVPSAALDKASLDLVRTVRASRAPGEVTVTGASARFVDQQRSLGDRLPLALAILALTTLVILFAMTGSVVLPVKALVMNVLTISAAFGLLVLVFQDGRLEGLLDYSGQGAIESTQPLVLLAIAFGLTTDYGVFLLGRIKEFRDGGASNEEAVALGLERTGRIITAAALLFTVAIGAFATSEVIFIKQVGLGTAAAVLIDATIVRALLVPSLMKLLGEWNWWAPAPLRRLHARLGVARP
jgi:uncharacterized membrane protein YdfJ with MMPL/SSD domain